MKLSVRLAGLCGSGAFLLSALPGFYQQAKPTDIAQMATDVIPGVNIIETLLLSLGGAIVAGFIGYLIGDILSNPKGHPKKKKTPPGKDKPHVSAQPALLVPKEHTVDAAVADAPSSPTVEPENPLPGPE